MNATLDVSDVLDDPDFVSTFQVLRTTQTVSSGGIASDGPATTYNAIGSVQTDEGRSVQRMETGERNNDAIKIYTRFGLMAGVGDVEADQVLWNGGKYVVVTVRDWRAYGAGYVEAVCDLTDINVATDPLSNGSAGLSNLPPSTGGNTTSATEVGGGQIRYAEAAGSPSIAIPANQRTLLSFVIDPAQTNSYLNPPFAGNVSFDGTTITPRPGGMGDFYHILINLLVTSQVAGGSVRFDIDVGSPAGPTGGATEVLLNDAGVPERVTGNLYIQVLQNFLANGAKLYLTSTVPILLVNEAVVISCESA